MLANSGDGCSPGVEHVLSAYLASDDELLRSHAVWAAARIGRRDLLARSRLLQEERSEMVREELRRIDEVEPRPGGKT